LLLDQVRLSALPTHVHPLGIEGARLLALAVARASSSVCLDRGALYDELLTHCESAEFRQRIALAARIHADDQLISLGNGIAALESVPTAIASFTLTPESFAETIGNVILLGGDTDTMAAMAGAISGAFLGIGAIPPVLLEQLEDSTKGRSYLIALADRLCEAHESRLARAQP
jgi:poly(ADP-ribose) glycohydrolase ARH3